MSQWDEYGCGLPYRIRMHHLQPYFIFQSWLIPLAIGKTILDVNGSTPVNELKFEASTMANINRCNGQSNRSNEGVKINYEPGLQLSDGLAILLTIQTYSAQSPLT